MGIQIFKLAAKLIITGFLFRQAASEDEHIRKYNLSSSYLHAYTDSL
jgi:hypothetical protein